jgi:serine/tyrosine/threonine adenylyltransferase
MVRGGLYTYVRPRAVKDPELLCVSPAALRDLNIADDAVNSREFLDVLSGNRILGWEDVPDGGESLEGSSGSDDESLPKSRTLSEDDGTEAKGPYPWAQNYGGFQFGQWAGQLGDGRALSLFETTNPHTGVRYELQLKGAGKTPYSRFADGRAVLRASIREFVVSETLNALGIPTTRALSLVLAPTLRVKRETMEPGAIVSRFAQSWIRCGTFDLLRARGDRENLKKLAEYVAVQVYGGWEKLPGPLPAAPSSEASLERSPYDDISTANLLGPSTGHSGSSILDTGANAQNRFARLYRAICRANAATLAKWQLYGFTNGVLNTDNTSILGLSLDFGPFAFLDKYDPTYTPNHDDHMLRYSYRAQPSAILWNLTRLGEALGELIGLGDKVDDKKIAQDGLAEDMIPEVQERGETVITNAGHEFKAVFIAEFQRGMAKRLGLRGARDGDNEKLYSPFLDAMEHAEADFNHSFRTLSHISLQDLSDASLDTTAEKFLPSPESSSASVDREASAKDFAAFLTTYRDRLIDEASEWVSDAQRQSSMLQVNPKFLPRNWILEEVIQRVEKNGEREVLKRLINMATAPFEEKWSGDEAEAERWCGQVPKYKGGLQCSCSS